MTVGNQCRQNTELYRWFGRIHVFGFGHQHQHYPKRDRRDRESDYRRGCDQHLNRNWEYRRSIKLRSSIGRFGNRWDRYGARTFGANPHFFVLQSYQRGHIGEYELYRDAERAKPCRWNGDFAIQ